MPRRLPLALSFLALWATAAEARAQDTPAPAPAAEARATQEPAADEVEALRAEMKRLYERVEALEAEGEELSEALDEATRHKPIEVPHLVVPDGVRLRLLGYVDVGLFGTLGDGVSYVRDPAKVESRKLTSFPWLIPLPERGPPDVASAPWVFFGDPWANAVNSLGESADLGLDRTNIARFDPIQSHGRPSFLINTVNLGLLGTVGPELLFEVSLNVLPRTGQLGAAGDLIDVDLAYVEYKPFADVDLSLFAGKIESVFGREYRFRKAPDRFGVTPSIIARYTVGSPIGVKVRGSLLEGALVYNVALTNGSTLTEHFAHFYNEVDQNYFKTLSGRLSYGRDLELGVPVFFEVGASGLVGPQDGQTSDAVIGWQAGGDLKLVLLAFTLQAEYLRSVWPGGGIDGAASIEAEGAYAEASYQFLPWLGAMVRLDVRRAVLFAHPNLYLSDVGRATVAARFDLSWNVIGKIEYVRLQELSGPEIDDDVFTSSLILRF